MKRKRTIGVLVGVLAAGLAIAWPLTAARQTPRQRREAAARAFDAGNYRDAYEAFRKLALDPGDDPLEVGKDLDRAVDCLRRLGRVHEVDDFREAVIAAHKDNWRLLQSAARSYAGGEHYGYIVAGKYHRGYHRGGGRYVGSFQRDRVRALQLMHQALPLTKAEKDTKAVAQFHFQFADLLLNGAGHHEAWRLQYLTDLGQLPDYEEGYYWYGGTPRGAPVDEKGNPVYYKAPKSYETAANDGERWRWMLARTAELDPARASEVDLTFANFLRGQLGVQTLAYAGVRFGADEDAKTGTFALHTLGDDETIARLATGVKRFKVPDEFNWLKVYERVAARGKSEWGERALDARASIFEDRRQYPKAASAWRRAIKEYGPGKDNYRQKRLDQIVGAWGRFEPGAVQPAGKPATVDFRFRNGTRVSFEAFAVDVPKLLADVKAYLKDRKGYLDYNQTNIQNVGYRLVELNQKQYLGARVAAWNLGLKPRKDHVDDRVTVTTPLSKPGAYLLAGTMAGGNTSRILVWVSDTVIVRKQLEGQYLYYVADAVSGQPVPKAKLDFFGWKQVQVKPMTNEYKVETRSFEAETDADGQIVLDGKKMPENHQWLATATKAKAGAGGADRFAYLGFSGVWYGRTYDPEYNATKVFTITDRPVYRPEQKVHFKFWVRHAKYDQPDTSDFAGRTFTVQITNPRGEKVYEKAHTADEYGGVEGEYSVPKGATLGVYSVFLLHHGGGSFRVEEYKKPEYEVTVEAPKEPVRLGEQVKATVKARYYFGAPVTKAKVKVKVLRSAHSSEWYPRGKWDFFYGQGYWWFAGDYAWFPGWSEWGCKRPVPPWWGWAPHEQPEVVLEQEVPIGADGTVQVPLDTRPARELHGDQDHKYTITAEVVDESRRMVVGTGDVLVARKPFRVFAWVDRGHYRAGDTVNAGFRAQTLDGKPVQGKGELTLYRVTYDRKARPVQTAVQTWKLDTNAEGQAHQKMKAARAGQYRLSYKLTDAKKHTIEGGYLFVVRGTGFTGQDYRFNDLELVTDKREYAPGDKVRLLVNTNTQGGTVLLFVRPTSGVYLPPKVIRLKGKSTTEEVAVVQRDMPNFFVEALTVADGRVHTEVREVVVPPEKRVLNVEVRPSQQEYKPGQKATVKVRLTDSAGKPFVGSTVLSVYDKAVEYVSGGSNVPEIREFFWKWRRHHYPSTETSLSHYLGNLLRRGETGMSDLGIFGYSVVEEMERTRDGGRRGEGRKGREKEEAAPPGGPGGGFGWRGGKDKDADGKPGEGKESAPGDAAPGRGPGAPGGPEPAVRRNFADTAFWKGSLKTDKEGIAEVTFPMPENLTAWKVRVWAMGHGTKVGQGEAEVTTKKDLLVRLQAPRFFVQKDEVVLSANVHNYLKTEKKVTVSLELDGGVLSPLGKTTRVLSVASKEDKRVDWRVKVTGEGRAVVRVKAITDEDSDAMEMRFPAYVHGLLKTDSFTGVVRPDQHSAKVGLIVPAERRVEQSRLVVRYSPTLAGAMVDALPYLVDYPYGCTEQTLNRFLPTVLTQRTLQRMKVDLKEVRKKRTSLDSGALDDKKRSDAWKRYGRNPVFDEAEVKRMVDAGIQALAGMQCADGGWGWFSGYGERSWPHTTAVVVHGLQVARDNDVKVPQGMLDRGVDWLKNYQAEQVQKLKNAPAKVKPYKEHADNVDALVYMVLLDAGARNADMREFLYRDRTKLSAYAKAMFGLALHKEGGQPGKLAMVLENIEQFLVEDRENQTAYLELPGGNPWWYWYGSETEANAYYLKLLARTKPKDPKAAGLVKYLLNNRKHATYWNSTRDTAICVEAMADYLKASGEDKPDLTVEVWLDGKKLKEEKINAKNLFTFDPVVELTGKEVKSGKHTLEIKRKGTGPVYFNAWLTNFTLEDFISRAGLEVKVNRKYYKLTPVEHRVKVPGSTGRPADRKVEKYVRSELPNLSKLKSGDLVEVELEIDSKNDYEYLIFEDHKPAGFEALAVRSGYHAGGLGAYMEVRDEKVCFFVRVLARGKHSISYRMRAEIPGQFSALPTVGYAMYAPELKGNSDEIKLAVTD
jgi:alpha-2-macroglobulin